ncbi:ATP-binding domain-containing protein [Aequitasia blattaphilus]|uniref:ATP-binding domain-containing protein n=1 Tax=Aequitasia blattaphilus TaxID=2949332 RepID=UPI003A7F1021
MQDDILQQELSQTSDEKMKSIITSIPMSKGLEFDEVIIPNGDRATYSSEYDRGLLYIACTRAMHRLMVLYVGELTELVTE